MNILTVLLGDRHWQSTRNLLPGSIFLGVLYILILRCNVLKHYTYIRRMLSALPHDYVRTMEPGTRSQISASFSALGDETSRAHKGGAPRAGGRSPRPSGNVCAEFLRLEVFWKPEVFLLPRLGQPWTEHVWGVASVARSGPRRSTTVFYFLFGRTRVCIRGTYHAKDTDIPRTVVSLPVHIYR